MLINSEPLPVMGHAPSTLPRTARSTGSNQGEVIDFLANAPLETGQGGPVERIDTHAAIVFLAGRTAIKIKKAVKLPYLDFSTPDLRQQALARELEINRPNAPEIYRELVPIVRDATGGLKLGGPGEPVEWVLLMTRFEQHRLMDRIAESGPIRPDLVKALAEAVIQAHRRAPVVEGLSSAAAMSGLIDQFSTAIADHATIFGAAAADDFRTLAHRALERARDCLEHRAAAGFVRRCHGDLHLANIVLLDGQPVLFDALEFDEALATVDVLHDLAFLLMDLDLRGQRPAANGVLNRYLQGAPGNDEGLVGLPLFLGLRAAVRAVVTADRLVQQEAGEAARLAATSYVSAAFGYLDPPPPRLIAIGGFSGTGKSTLGRMLAPGIGAAPGAVHLRSDVERKALFGVAETAPLASDHYDRATTERVYGILEDRARTILQAGHSAIADAVYARPEERNAIEAVARGAGTTFTDLWLSAPADELARRVSARRGDASDATAAVVRTQIERGAGTTDWQVIDASGEPEDVAETARLQIAAGRG